MIRILLWIAIPIALFAIIFFIYQYINAFGFALPVDDKGQNSIGAWGTFGDYFGGTLNPILAFCSFLALCYTINLQNKQLQKTDEQLKQNAKALELNSQELKNSTRQLEISAQAQAEMEKTQRLQRFEGLFTYMANELVKIYDDFKEDKEIQSKNLERKQEENKEKSMKTAIQGHHVIANLGFYFSEKTYLMKIDEITKNLRSNFKAVRFFMYLYQILKFIDSQDMIDEKEKKFYSNLIRSSIENDILQLVFLNCLHIEKHQEDFKYYNKLVAKYQFFEHMTFSQDNKLLQPLVYLSSFHDKMAFGKSHYYQELLVDFLKENYNKSIYINFYSDNYHCNIDNQDCILRLECNDKTHEFNLRNFEIINENLYEIDLKFLTFNNIIFKIYPKKDDIDKTLLIKLPNSIHLKNNCKDIEICLMDTKSSNINEQVYIPLAWKKT